MMPFLVSHLGESDYGLWILIVSISGSLYIFDLGFTEAITRFIGDSLNKKKYDRTNQVISTALLIYSLLAGVIVVATLIIVFFSDHFVEQKNNLVLIQILIAITGCTLALQFPFKAFAGIAVTNLRHDLLSTSRITNKLLTVSVTVYLVINGHGLITIALIGFASSQLGGWLFLVIARYLFKEMKISSKSISKPLFWDIFHFSKWTFLIDFSRILKQRMDLFVIAAYLSSSILTNYYVALRLVEYSMQFLTTATNFTTPLFIKYNAENDTQQIIEKLCVFSRLNLLLVGSSFGFFFHCGQRLITLWMGKEFDSATAYQVLLILMLGRALGYITTPAGSVLIAGSKPKILSIIGVCETIVSVFLIFLFVAGFKFGVIGAALGLSLSFVITRIAAIPYFSCKHLSISLFSYYKKLISPMVILIIFISIWWGILEFVIINNFIQLIIFALLYSATAILVVLLSLDSNELNMLSTVLPGKSLKYLFAIKKKHVV